MKTLGTYLQAALKDNSILRWPEKLMPLKVYVAPFRWYQKSKQQDSCLYNMYVSEALKIWSEATDGHFKCIMTNDYKNSNINVLWRRVNRSSLGLCHVDATKEYMIYSAELEIGISDGIIYSAYQNVDEVKHTIIHEMGHSLGLPHSPYIDDLMYIPHQYGVVNITERDRNTARWLYALEPGFNPAPFMKDWGLEPTASIDDLIWLYEHQDDLEKLQPEQNNIPEHLPEHEKVILKEQETLASKNLYQMSLQHIKVDLAKKRHTTINNTEEVEPVSNNPFFNYNNHPI